MESATSTTTTTIIILQIRRRTAACYILDPPVQSDYVYVCLRKMITMNLFEAKMPLIMIAALLLS